MLPAGVTLWFLIVHPGRVPAGEEAEKAGFRLEVREKLLDKSTEGRFIVILSQRKNPEPRFQVGNVLGDDVFFIGKDGVVTSDGGKIHLDRQEIGYPTKKVGDLPRGKYLVQAVFDHNPDLRLLNAPENLFSKPVEIQWPPTDPGPVLLKITEKMPVEKLPPDRELVRYLKIPSRRLSEFHGRPMFLRAGLILPWDFEKEKDRKYPLWLRIGGFGSRFTSVGGMMQDGSGFQRAWNADDAPKMLLLFPDGAGPLGDPYQVNSANHGPFGDAITQELIPHVEKNYRGIGTGKARVLDGHSTGGWVSLALQVFYPDFFQGTWSHAPDPVDFRAFELINIYKHRNVFLGEDGKPRPACRDVMNKVLYTMSEEVAVERVLGRGNSFTTSGKDWGSWNATFSPRKANGLPASLWNEESGDIDPKVVEHWKKYDLHEVVRSNWPKLAPSLANKIRIWVGDRDDFYLNGAVELFDQSSRDLRPQLNATIRYGKGKGHGWRGLSEKQLMRDMDHALRQAKAN